MTVLINCKDVHLEYPAKRVLRGVTLGVDTGDRIGVVGRNGDGKSSLLQALAGADLPYTGEVTRRGALTVGVLEQADTLDDAQRVGRAVVGDLPEHEWAANRNTRDLIDTLLGDVSWDALVGTLSGGQRRRVDLARLLIGSWDVLLLDEPTNHLDMQVITWLAAHLKTRWATGSGALLVVTHDRWFLDEVCEAMWEVHDGVVETFEGGYSAYIQQRVERDERARRAEQRRRNIARKELAWLSRGAQARSTKPKFRVKEARDLIADEPPLRNPLELKKAAMTRLGKQVVDLEKVVVRYGSETESAEDDGLWQGDGTVSVGDGTILASALKVSRVASFLGTVAKIVPSPTDTPTDTETAGAGAGQAGRPPRPPVPAAPPVSSPTPAPTLNGIDWILGPGDRVGILGDNGAGKTTLLKVLSGELAPTGGRVKIGASVRFGYLSQRLDELAALAGERVREVLSHYKASYVVDGKNQSPAQLLERMGFERAHLNARIGDLSGGQKRRLQLLLTLLKEPNVLILDEPGNDMDTDMLAVMEDLLDSWPGTLILVSHDRYLTERVTDDQFALLDGRLRHVPGGVDEYLRLLDAGRQRGAQNQTLAAASSPRKAPAAAPGIDAYQLRKHISAIERKLHTLQTKDKKLTAQMHEADPTDYQHLISLGEEQRNLRTHIAQLEQEWFEKSELL